MFLIVKIPSGKVAKGLPRDKIRIALTGHMLFKGPGYFKYIEKISWD
jgi:hypothetical protein